MWVVSRIVTPSWSRRFFHVTREVAARGRIEARGGLVHEQHLRPVQQRLGDFDAAPQPARERLHEVLAAVGQAQALHGAFHALAQYRAAQAVQVALGAQVLLHGERLVQALRLENHAHLPAHCGGVAHHVVARR